MMASEVTITGGNSVTTTTGNISDDCVEMVLEEYVQAHGHVVIETTANGESAHSLVRHSAGRKFNQEDPIEAAAAERILKRMP